MKLNLNHFAVLCMVLIILGFFVTVAQNNDMHDKMRATSPPVTLKSVYGDRDVQSVRPIYDSYTKSHFIIVKLMDGSMHVIPCDYQGPYPECETIKRK